MLGRAAGPATFASRFFDVAPGTREPSLTSGESLWAHRAWLDVLADVATECDADADDGARGLEHVEPFALRPAFEFVDLSLHALLRDLDDEPSSASGGSASTTMRAPSGGGGGGGGGDRPGGDPHDWRVAAMCARRLLAGARNFGARLLKVGDDAAAARGAAMFGGNKAGARASDAPFAAFLSWWVARVRALRVGGVVLFPLGWRATLRAAPPNGEPRASGHFLFGVLRRDADDAFELTFANSPGGDDVAADRSGTARFAPRSARDAAIASGYVYHPARPRASDAALGVERALAVVAARAAPLRIIGDGAFWWALLRPLVRPGAITPVGAARASSGSETARAGAAQAALLYETLAPFAARAPMSRENDADDAPAPSYDPAGGAALDWERAPVRGDRSRARALLAALRHALRRGALVEDVSGSGEVYECPPIGLAAAHALDVLARGAALRVARRELRAAARAAASGRRISKELSLGAARLEVFITATISALYIPRVILQSPMSPISPILRPSPARGALGSNACGRVRRCLRGAPRKRARARCRSIARDGAARAPWRLHGSR